ncbi:MAG: hypothetical protein P8Y79_08400 [Ignavibacteriaceae bacterium]
MQLQNKRKDNEPPFAISKKGMWYHHIGIPTVEQKPDERYLEEYKMYVSGFDTSEFGIEWMRFENDSPVSDIIQKIPHIAFEVDNLDTAIMGKELIGEISSPSKGVRVAMILENGVPVEFLEFNRNME